MEREVEKSDFLKFMTMTFDESSNFLLYPTIFGVKIVNIYSNTFVRYLGKPENMRILAISLFQGKVKKGLSSNTLELEAADNPTLDNTSPDPTLFCTSYKKNRFYMLTRRDYGKMNESSDRDVFNEKPSKEEIISATDDASKFGIIHDVLKYHFTHVLHCSSCTKDLRHCCDAYDEGGHNFAPVWEGMPQDGGKLLRSCQKWILQWSHIS